MSTFETKIHVLDKLSEGKTWNNPVFHLTLEWISKYPYIVLPWRVENKRPITICNTYMDITNIKKSDTQKNVYYDFICTMFITRQR